MVDWSKAVRGRFKNVKRIELAESTQVGRHRASLDRLLRTMAEVSGEDWTFNSVLITDQSSVGDFLSEDAEALLLSVKLGFAVARGDYLVDIAIRLEPPQ